MAPSNFQPALRAAAARRLGQRGFTLVELMVALSGGLFLSIVVLALGRDTGRFYQQETRIASATLSGLAGFDRLTADVERAGYLVTPNIDADPRVCNRPQASWPTLLGKLRSLVITDGGSTITGTELVAAGITPDSVVIAGAISNLDSFPIAELKAAGGGWEIYLQRGTGPLGRLGLGAGATKAQIVAALSAVFLAADGSGRAVRLAGGDGSEQYGLVASVDANDEAESQPIVRLAGTPALQTRTGTQLCGTKGFMTGASLNIVNFIRYDIRKLKDSGDAAYAPLFTASDGAPFESGRAELVRQELTPNNAPIPGTLEIVAEYAVDLNFRLLQATSSTNTAVSMVAGDSPLTSTTTQLVRGVQARLSVRSREADRQAAVSSSTDVAAGLYRIRLGTGAGPNFARVRTFQANLAIRNHEGRNW